ncbi:hypothetical protein EP331_06500 [bacterium]|nr:MAG: hypothetical protein EP331_06500 [bacterium]
MFKKITVSIVCLAAFACTNEKPQKETNSSETITVQLKDVQTQLTYCYSCHNPKSESHDAILAPPFVAVKKRYMMSYADKEAFVNAVSSFAKNPNQDKALMRGAIGQYGMMVPAPFTEEQLKQVATYLFENEIEAPAWFDEHEKQMHGQMGMGQGKQQSGSN